MDEPKATNEAEFESVILDIFREVLAAPDLDYDDDFFAAGGDSLAAVAVTTELEGQFAIEDAMPLVFMYPTARELARALTEDALKG